MNADRAGAMIQARADELRAQIRPLGLWARFMGYFGVETSAARQARELAEEADRCEVGGRGERLTVEIVSALGDDGWYGFWSRPIPGAKVADADTALAPPCGTFIVLLDSKYWSSKGLVRAEGKVLKHGERDCRDIRSILFETKMLTKALREAAERGQPRPSVIPIIVVHNAPVADEGFTLQDVRVLPAHRLLDELRDLVGRRNPALAAQVAEQADRVLRDPSEEDEYE
ncbi:hypothetical protein [Streptomyces mirabilis]|uniref:hypothetical protein n=1 Tax=Streptomyces mirabilis TaxID=68239 RepID=UPI0033C55FCF